MGLRHVVRLPKCLLIFVALHFLLLTTVPRSAAAETAERTVTLGGPGASSIALTGEWSFVPGAFVETVEHGGESVPTQVAESWDSLTFHDGRKGSDIRFGTYALRLHFGAEAASGTALAIAFPYQMHAARIVVRSGPDRWSAESGIPGKNLAEEVPLHRPIRVDFPARAVVDVFVHISSHVETRRGGMRRAPHLGLQQVVEHERRDGEWRDIFLIGALALVALYHGALAALRPRERAPIWFALLAAVMALRTAIFANLFELANPPMISWLVSQQLVYATISLPVIFTVRYLDALFTHLIPRAARHASDVTGSVLVVLAFVASERAYIALSNAGQLYAFAAIMGLAVALVRGLFRGADRLLLGALVGFLTLALAALRDLFMMRQTVREHTFLAPYGLLGFIVIQALVVATQNERARRHTEDLLASISNFVPKGFLELLGRADLSTVRLGDAVERDLTVLFADVRGFTTISERLGPKEIFGLLNEWFGRIGPHVPANHGFIDKYIGDAIMALFPRSADDAVRAAVAMQREVATMHVVLPAAKKSAFDSVAGTASVGAKRLRIGIGIHKGGTMLGTVGEKGRFEATVISDAVNLASRIEGVTATLGVRVLISGDVADHLSPEFTQNLRPLGAFLVKGRRTPIDLFEVLDAEDETLRAQKIERFQRFYDARQALLAGDAELSERLFGVLVQEVPHDGPAHFFLRVAQGEGALIQRRVVVLLEKGAASSMPSMASLASISGTRPAR